MKYLINFEVEVNDNQKPKVKLLSLEEAKVKSTLEPEMTTSETYADEFKLPLFMGPEELQNWMEDMMKLPLHIPETTNPNC